MVYEAIILRNDCFSLHPSLSLGTNYLLLYDILFILHDNCPLARDLWLL
jgi:hypothetical protein